MVAKWHKSASLWRGIQDNEPHCQRPPFARFFRKSGRYPHYEERWAKLDCQLGFSLIMRNLVTLTN